MKIALLVATPQEAEPLSRYFNNRIHLKAHHNLEIIVTGVGLVNTTYSATKQFLTNKPDLAIQGGIAGSMHALYPPGSVVTVSEEMIGDMGVREDGRWKDMTDLMLQDQNAFPMEHGRLVNPHTQLLSLAQLDAVRAVSVNEITTSFTSDRQWPERYAPVVESMEGAAFHYVCLQEHVPFIQIRSISNFAGERNKANWKLDEAVQNLNNTLITFINKLSELTLS